MPDRIPKLTDEMDGLRVEMGSIREELAKFRQSGIVPNHSFFLRHLGSILTIAGWLVTLGIGYNRFQSLEAMFQKSELHGSEFAREGIQENRTQNAFLGGRVAALEVDSKDRNVAIQSLLSDMRLVREWIEEQRYKEKNKLSTVIK